LVCGGAGSGKTILAVEFIVHGAHDFEEPGVYLSFDETAKELAENIASIGIDLADLIQRKQVIVDHVVIDRSELTATGDYNLDGLFVRLGQAIKTIGAKRVVLDSVESIFAALPNEILVRAESEGADHFEAVVGLADPVDHAGFDQIDQALGDQFGVHAEVVTPGVVRVGDAVEVLD
jgi:KaiC/GvpD/RAD55 family RecA-like ATPase